MVVLICPLVCPLVVLVFPLVVLVFPLVVPVCSLVVLVSSFVCPLVVLAVLSVGLFIADNNDGWIKNVERWILLKIKSLWKTGNFIKNQKLMKNAWFYEIDWPFLSCLTNLRITNWKNEFSLSLIRLGVNLTPVWFLQKCIFYRKSEALLFYKCPFLHIFSQMTFYVIINHIPENFIEITQVVHNIWKFYSSILTIFHLLFGFISLIQIN